MKKLCSKCRKPRDGSGKYCRSCNKEYQRGHYQRNKKIYKARAKQKKNEVRQLLYEYMQGRVCIDCEEDRIPALQFDHVKGIKKQPIAKMVANRCSWETILKEIEKCVIRCANCHAVKTAEEQGWYKDLVSGPEGEVVELPAFQAGD